MNLYIKRNNHVKRHITYRAIHAKGYRRRNHKSELKVAL